MDMNMKIPKLQNQGTGLTPFDHPANQIDQVDSKIKAMGKFYMNKEKVINNPYFLGE